MTIPHSIQMGKSIQIKHPHKSSHWHRNVSGVMRGYIGPIRGFESWHSSKEQNLAAITDKIIRKKKMKKCIENKQKYEKKI